MKIYLCRHGNRQPNGSERDQPVHLTDFGQDQARRLGAYLREQNLNALFSSPKVRALETAVPTSKYTRLPVSIWPALIEYDSYGPLDYLPGFITPYGYLDETMLLPGTPAQETLEFAYRRAKLALARLRTLPYERVAIFAHDYFNSIFIKSFLGHGSLTEPHRYPQDECCVNILEDGKPPQINLNVLGI